MNKDLEKRIWWNYLHEDLKELIKESTLLVERVEKWDEKFHDYAFVVFPAAKAYEGFLKHLFFDLGFIDKEDFQGKRFRVGKALNPALEKRYREKEGVYDRIVRYCNGRLLADKLWNTWKQCRNLLFHWFPSEKNAIDFSQAKEKVGLILDTMNEAFKECNIETISNNKQ